MSLPERGRRDPLECTSRTLPDDVRRFLRPLEQHSPGPPLAPVALSVALQLGGALSERGRLGPHDCRLTRWRTSGCVRKSYHGDRAYLAVVDFLFISTDLLRSYSVLARTTITAMYSSYLHLSLGSV